MDDFHIFLLALTEVMEDGDEWVVQHLDVDLAPVSCKGVERPSEGAQVVRVHAPNVLALRLLVKNYALHLRVILDAKHVQKFWHISLWVIL